MKKTRATYKKHTHCKKCYTIRKRFINRRFADTIIFRKLSKEDTLFILTLAQRSIDPFQQNIAAASIYLFLFVGVIMLIRFLFFIRAEHKKNKRLEQYFNSYRELVRKSNENLNALACLCMVSPLCNFRIQTLLAQEQTDILEMLSMLDNAPDGFLDESSIDARYKELLKNLVMIKKLRLPK